MNGEVEEIRNSTHNKMTHARATRDECELEPCRPFSHCSVRSCEEGGIASKESVRVALLQTLGKDGVIWSTLR